jgi:hypothetical protein
MADAARQISRRYNVALPHARLGGRDGGRFDRGSAMSAARYGIRQEDAPLLPPQPIALPKRAAWFLDELVKAGATGVTTISYPGVRVSDCLLKIRRAGVDVQTVYESHDGEFSGRHGRYILRRHVELIADEDPPPHMRQPSPDHAMVVTP